MNVLLSFAQFEREVTGEQIRDKIAVREVAFCKTQIAHQRGPGLFAQALRVTRASASEVTSTRP